MHKPRWVAIGLATVLGCTEGPSPAGPAAAALEVADAGAAIGVSASATGGGHYILSGLIIQFGFSAVAGTGGAAGQFHHRLDTGNGIADFHGAVTCLAVDDVNHRAWIGGVITQNNSTDPAFQVDTLHAVGLDIWFRVVDYGEGAAAPPDRTTFTGFKHAAGFLTSADYCAGKPWPAGDARTWPVTGNVQVR